MSRFTATFGPIVGLLLVSGLAGAGLPRAKGWREEGKARTYSPKTIYQAINGAAELFISYGFRGLLEQGYRTSKKKKKKKAVTVQVYDQGSALGAFGVFSRERGKAFQPLKVGAAGAFKALGHCAAYQSRHYVKIQTVTGKLKLKDCQLLLKKVMGWLPGRGVAPAELALLPTADRVTSSEGYAPESYLGLRKLQNCVFAEYRGAKDKKTYTLFIVLPPKGKGTQKLWSELASGLKAKPAGADMLLKQVPYRGAVVLLKSAKGIFGATGIGAERAKSVLRAAFAK